MSTEFICLDCETTGLDFKNDRIIEIACVSFNIDTNLKNIEHLINPEVVIPQTSIDIHHITQEMVKDKPLIQEILPQILSFVGNKIIVGHGIDLDVKFIGESCVRAG